MLKHIDLGKIQLGPEVTVSDPAYIFGSRWQQQLKRVLPGWYHCSVNTLGAGGIDDPVTSLIAVHDHYDCDLGPDSESYKIGVDGGQAGIFDSEYYKTNHPDKKWFDHICNITLDYVLPAGTTHNAGCVSASGYGDGFYPVYVCRNGDGEIVGIRIEFIDDNNINGFEAE